MIPSSELRHVADIGSYSTQPRFEEGHGTMTSRGQRRVTSRFSRDIHLFYPCTRRTKEGDYAYREAFES